MELCWAVPQGSPPHPPFPARASSSLLIRFTPCKLKTWTCSWGCRHLHTTFWPALSVRGINGNECSKAALYPRVLLGCFLHYTLLQQGKTNQAFVCLLFWPSPEAGAAADRCPGRHKLWDLFFWLGKSGRWWTHCWSIPVFYMIFLEVVRSLSSYVFKLIHLQVLSLWSLLWTVKTCFLSFLCSVLMGQVSSLAAVERDVSLAATSSQTDRDK